MKNCIFALLLIPSFSQAQALPCLNEAVQYALEHMENFQEEAVLSRINIPENPGVGGLYSYGIEFLTESQKKIVVIPLMTPKCVQLDIQAF